MEQDSNNEAKNAGIPTTETGNITLKAEFTPGPWEAINESSEYASSLAESHWYIAADNDGLALAVTIGDSVDEEAANARLIAAAPAMYAALLATPCTKADFDGDTCEFWNKSYEQEMCDRCAALALATKPKD